jgi:hypothetical protein
MAPSAISDLGRPSTDQRWMLTERNLTKPAICCSAPDSSSALGVGIAADALGACALEATRLPNYPNAPQPSFLCGGQLAAEEAAASEKIHDIVPLRHVRSVNLLPDWAGWGVIRRIELLPGAALDCPALLDFELYGKAGDRVALPPAGFTAMGWVVVASDNGPEAAAEAMQDALRFVMIDIGPTE